MFETGSKGADVLHNVWNVSLVMRHTDSVMHRPDSLSKTSVRVNAQKLTFPQVLLYATSFDLCRIIIVLFNFRVMPYIKLSSSGCRAFPDAAANEI